MKTSLIVIHFFLFTSVIASPDFIPGDVSKGKGSVSGTIKDNNAQTPLEYANIVLYLKEDSSLITGTISSADGFFKINDVAYGKYYISIEFIGYSKQIIDNIDLNTENKTINLGEIVLKNSSLNLNEVSVVADKNPVDFKLDKKIVNVSQQLNAQGGTIADVLNNTPSVTTDQEGNILLRGSQNFTLLIDGKPSVLSSTDLLKTLPASQVENIEIITNPSARYSAEGTSGIINVITKKNSNNGLNGVIEAGTATWNKYNGNLLLNLKKNKVNYFVGADINSLPTNSFNSFTRYYHNNEKYIIKDSTEMWMKRVRNNFKAGFEYTPNENNTISFSAEAGHFAFLRNIDIYYKKTDTLPKYMYFSYGTDDFSVASNYINSNIFYKHNFPKKGHEFSTLIYYGIFNVTTDGYSENTATDSKWNNIENPGLFQMAENGVGSEARIKMDYVYPFNEKYSLEAGVYLSSKNSNSDKNVSRYDYSSGTWLADSNYISEAFYSKNILAAYGMLNGNFSGVDYQIGLRAEYINRTLGLTTLNMEYPYDKLNLFPSAFLSKNISEKNQLQANYSRRIRHPEDWLLNPTPNYSDTYSIELGNPDLMPETTDSYEFNYLHKMAKGYISLGLFHRNTQNSITRTSKIDDGDIMVFTSINMGNTYASGTEINFNYNFNKSFSINGAASYFYSQFKGYLFEQKVENSGQSYTVQLMPLLKIKKNTKIQVTLIYQSPTQEPLSNVKPSFVTGLTIRQNVLKQKATLSLNINDVFSTGAYEVYSKNNGFDSHLFWKNESPVVRVSFSYKINNYQRSQIKYETNDSVI